MTLVDKGHELDELDEGLRDWNATRRRRRADRRRGTLRGMIYCVVPQALAGELFDKLSDYYKDDPQRHGHHRPARGPGRRRPARIRPTATGAAGG